MKRLLIFLAFLSSPPRVSITVTPAAVLVNETLRLVCTVPRHPDNRWLTMGIPGYRTSGGDLDGEAAPITHTMFVTHVPCEVDEVVCEVTDALGRTYRAARPITVAGCGQSSSDW